MPSLASSLCGDALGRAADGDSDLIALWRSHGPKLAQYCLNEALPLQPSELNEHLNDPEDYALHADDGWEIEAAYDDDIYEEEAYDADSTDASTVVGPARGSRAVPVVVVSCRWDGRLCSISHACRESRRRPARGRRPGRGFKYVDERHAATVRAFFAEADASLRAVGTSAASLTEALPGVDRCWFLVRELLSLFTDQAAERGHF